MVVLTIVAQTNGETVYFDQPIPQVHYMRLVSCSLYNSWHNLKKVGIISVDKSNVCIAEIPQGHYDLMSLEKELKSSIDEKKAELSFKLNQISLIQCLNLSTQNTINFQSLSATLWPT